MAAEAGVAAAVFPTGNGSIDGPLQAAAEFRPETETIAATVVTEGISKVTGKGVACAAAEEECLLELGPAIEAQWILLARNKDDATIEIALFDVASQLELVTVDAPRMADAAAQTTQFDLALGRLFNPQASGSIEVQTDPDTTVILDAQEKKRGPVALFENIAPGKHQVSVLADDGRQGGVVVMVEGGTRANASVVLGRAAGQPLLITGLVTAAIGAAIVVVSVATVGAMQAAISPLYLGTPDDREYVFKSVAVGAAGAAVVGGLTVVAGGVMAGVGLLVE